MKKFAGKVNFSVSSVVSVLSVVLLILAIMTVVGWHDDYKAQMKEVGSGSTAISAVETTASVSQTQQTVIQANEQVSADDGKAILARVEQAADAIADLQTRRNVALSGYMNVDTLEAARTESKAIYDELAAYFPENDIGADLWFSFDSMAHPDVAWQAGPAIEYVGTNVPVIFMLKDEAGYPLCYVTCVYDSVADKMIHTQIWTTSYGHHFSAVTDDTDLEEMVTDVEYPEDQSVDEFVDSVGELTNAWEEFARENGLEGVWTTTTSAIPLTEEEKAAEEAYEP